jgi:hypothetical protein
LEGSCSARALEDRLALPVSLQGFGQLALRAQNVARFTVAYGQLALISNSWTISKNGRGFETSRTRWISAGRWKNLSRNISVQTGLDLMRPELKDSMWI